MRKGVGRQEGVEAGVVWTFCRQQLGAVETRGGIRTVKKNIVPVLGFQPIA
jgi:hypothetical protein